MTSEERALFDRLSAMYEATVRQADESKSNFVSGWYMGKAAGIQSVMIILLDDEEFTLDIMRSQDRTYQSLRNVENLYKDKK